MTDGLLLVGNPGVHLTPLPLCLRKLGGRHWDLLLYLQPEIQKLAFLNSKERNKDTRGSRTFVWFIAPFIRVTTSGEAQSTEVLHDYPARSPPLKEQAFKTPESAQHRPRRHGSYCFKAVLLAPASSSRGSWQKRTEMSTVTMQML